MANDYDIGYGKPPKHTQFSKGQSGNPNGRPKGSRNFKTDVKAALQMPVQINSGGRQRKVSSQEAAILRLRGMALNGDLRALLSYLGLGREFNNEELETAIAKSVSAEDRALMENHQTRIRRQANAAKPRRKSKAKKP